MRVIIAEDIIRKVLNESIDDFLIKEGLLDGSILGSAWNGLKNATAAYMDKRTHGQWNRKYNIPVKGKGMVVGTYILKKWLNTRYNRLYDIIYNGMQGNRQSFYLKIDGRSTPFTYEWKNNSYVLYDNNYGRIYTLRLNYHDIPSALTVTQYGGYEIGEDKEPKFVREKNSYEFNFPEVDSRYIIKPVIVYCAKDTSTPESYIARNCGPNAFYRDTQYTLEDGDFKNNVIRYLNVIQNENKKNMNADKPNYKHILNLFKVSSFYDWLYGGMKDAEEVKPASTNTANSANNDYNNVSSSNSNFNWNANSSNDYNYNNYNAKKYRGYETDELTNADFDY